LSGRHKDPEYHKKWWEANKHRYRDRAPKTPEISKRDYENSKDKKLEFQKAKRGENPEWRLWKSAKGSSKRRGILFDICIEDVVIPDICPVLRVPMQRFTQYTPSIDRIDTSKGYTKDNIQVISKKANIMKYNASREELLLFAQWVLDG